MKRNSEVHQKVEAAEGKGYSFFNAFKKKNGIKFKIGVFAKDKEGKQTEVKPTIESLLKSLPV